MFCVDDHEFEARSKIQFKIHWSISVVFMYLTTRNNLTDRFLSRIKFIICFDVHNLCFIIKSRISILTLLDIRKSYTLFVTFKIWHMLHWNFFWRYLLFLFFGAKLWFLKLNLKLLLFLKEMFWHYLIHWTIEKVKSVLNWVSS